VVAGGAFGVLALEDRAAWDQVPSRDLEDRARTRAIAADALLGGGAALLVGASLLYALTGHGASTMELAGGGP
jgi:hypothetical protein